MTGAFIFLLSTSLILLTLIQDFKMNLIFRDELCLTFDFLFLKFSLYPFKNSRSPYEKPTFRGKKLGSITKKIRKSQKRARYLRSLLENTDIKIISVNIPIDKDTPYEYVMKRQALSNFISFLISLLSENARSFKTCDSDFFKAEGNSLADINISFTTTPLDALCAFIKELFLGKRKIRV